MLYILCWVAASERTVVTSKAGCQGRALDAGHDSCQTSARAPRSHRTPGSLGRLEPPSDRSFGKPFGKRLRTGLGSDPEVALVFCPNCGTKNDDTATSCTKCGFKLSGASAAKFRGTMMLNTDQS